MYMLDLKKYIYKGIVISSLLVTASFGNSSDNKDRKLKLNVDGAVIYPIKNGKYEAYYLNKQNIKNFNHGRVPTKKEIKAWDLDVMPDGTGLPNGSGSVEQGDELYSAQCAYCHGEFGTGGSGYPTLAGGEGSLKNQLLTEGDEPPIRTIGSYWPYASTLFWYIQSAMPFPNPKSLSNDETYALVAYMLSINDITIDGEELEDEYVLNKEKFLKIKMPNEKGFYPVNPTRNDLKEIRKPLAQGTRCMTNCKTFKPVSIANEITGFDPAISTLKDLPKQKKSTSISYEQKAYNESCSACHSNEAVGAPMPGDKAAWDEILEKGINKVYLSGINGINGMPPKGGNMDLSDIQFNKIVDYMIDFKK